MSCICICFRYNQLCSKWISWNDISCLVLVVNILSKVIIIFVQLFLTSVSSRRSCSSYHFFIFSVVCHHFKQFVNIIINRNIRLNRMKFTITHRADWDICFTCVLSVHVLGLKPDTFSSCNDGNTLATSSHAFVRNSFRQQLCMDIANCNTHDERIIAAIYSL